MNPILAGFVRSLVEPWACGVMLLVLASRCRTTSSSRRDDFLTGLGFVMFSALVYLHMILITHIPHTIDLELWRIDEHLGWQPMLVHDWLQAHDWRFAWWFLRDVYLWLPFAMAFAWVSEQNHVMRRAVVLGGLACWFFYATFPAAGPIYLAKGLAPFSARNCMPSMHFSWALMLAINARRWRVGWWMYAGVIGVATVGLGEHYLIDLIAAVPYTFGVQWLATRALWKRRTQIPNLATGDQRVPELVP